MEAYIRAYRALLQGQTVEWEGARMRMLHPPGHAAPRPVEVPVLIAALGPRGATVAHELGDGLFITLMIPEFAKDFSSVSYLFWGTILDDGEDSASDRVRAAGGPGWALAYRGAYEFGAPLDQLPGGAEWQAVVNRTSLQERHLTVHELHGVGLNAADQAAWDAGGHQMLQDVTVSGTPDQVRDRLGTLAGQGVTEIVFQPCGPDIRRELDVFMNTAKATAPM